MRTGRAALVLGWVLFATWTSTPARAGDVAGQVVIKKRLTAKRVALASYELRGISAATPKDNSSPLNECSRVVVFLQGSGLPPGEPVSAQIEQKNRRFDPDILHVPIGFTVGFPNSDPVFHNVFSLSKTGGFDLGYYAEGRTRTVRFDKPGVVQVYCHIQIGRASW